MPVTYRRKRTMKKRVYRKKRPMNISRPRRVNGGSVFRCKRTFWQSVWTPSTVTTSDFWKWLTFDISQLASITDFTALFDQYKLNGVKVTLRPRYDNFAGNDTVDTTLPGVTNQGSNTIHIINDKYSQVTPTGAYNATTLNTFLENGAVRSYQGTKPISFYVKPTVDAYIGLATFASRKPAPWLNTNILSTKHYGAHVFCQDVNMTGVFGQSYDIFYTYYMSFKAMK